MTVSFRFFGALVGILFSFALVAAQPSTTFSGTVKDGQGAVVAGAAVTIFDRAGAFQTTTITNDRGGFRFARVPSGEALVRIEAAGFSQQSQAVRIVSGQDTVLEVTLEAAGAGETVVVTAAGTPQTVDEVSKAYSVVDARDLDRRDEYSIAEGLRNVPGFRVQQLGGPGTQTAISIRGLRSYDTSVLVDGFRLRDTASTQGESSAQLQELFAVGTERIEVVRGSGSSLYGTNAIGGVINLVTDQGGGPARGQILMEGGGLGFFRGRAQVAGGAFADRLVYSAGLMHLNVSSGVNGDVPTRSWSGQGFARYRLSPRFSVSGRILGNTSFLQLNDSAFAVPGVALPPTGSIVDARVLSLTQQRNFEAGRPIVPGSANFIPNLRDPDNRRDSDFVTGLVTFDGRLTDSWNVRAGYQRVRTNRRFSDGPAGVRFEPAFANQSDFNGTIDTVNLRSDSRLGKWNFLTVGYEFERETFDNGNRDFNPDLARRVANSFTIRQRSNTFFIQDQVQGFDGRFQASAAFRLQQFDLSRPEFRGGNSVYTGLTFAAPKSAYTGDASALYFFRSTGTKIRAHIGNGYRAPSLFERFGNFFFSGTFSSFGDPRLRPERSIAMDAGIDQNLISDRVRVSATYFYTRLQETIAFDSSGFVNPRTDPFGRFSGYINVGGGMSRGVELSVTARPWRTMEISSAYTYANAQNRTPSSVPNFLRTFTVPRHIFTTVATQRIGKNVDVAFDLYASSSYFFPFSGRAFRFQGPVKADVVVGYTMAVGENSLRLYGKIDNIGNFTYFENGFRTPGTTFVGGAAFRF